MTTWTIRAFHSIAHRDARAYFAGDPDGDEVRCRRAKHYLLRRAERTARPAVRAVLEDLRRAVARTNTGIFPDGAARKARAAAGRRAALEAR